MTGAVKDSLTRHMELVEVTRPRVRKNIIRDLREHSEFLLVGDEKDRQLGHGLTVLLDMHDRLEALRYG